MKGEIRVASGNGSTNYEADALVIGGGPAGRQSKRLQRGRRHASWSQCAAVP